MRVFEKWKFFAKNNHVFRKCSDFLRNVKVFQKRWFFVKSIDCSNNIYIYWSYQTTNKPYMQTAIITLSVQSDGKQFLAKDADIFKKAHEKLLAGEYTCDIAEAPIQSPNPA